MTEAQIINSAASQNLQVNYFKAAVANSTLTVEQKASIIAAYEQTAATKAQAAATGTATVATGGFKAALVGLGNVIKAHPIIALFTTLAIVIPVAVALFDKFNVSAEEQAEKTRELSQEFEQLSSELSTTKSELDKVSERIKELQKLAQTGSLTPDQAEELEQLESLNRELQIEYDVRKKLADIKQREAEKSAVETYGKRRYAVVEDNSTEDRPFEFNVPDGKITIDDVAMNMPGIEAMRSVMSTMDMLVKSKQALDEEYAKPNTGMTEHEYSRQSEELQRLSEQYEKLAEQIATDLNMDQSSMDGLTQEGAELKASILDVLEEWNNWGQEVPDILSNTKDGLDDGVNSLDEYAKLLEKFQGAKNSLEQYRKALESLGELGDGAQIPIDLMADLVELCPEAAGLIRTVEDAQQALNDKIAEQQGVAEATYSEMILANQDWLENTINSSARLQTSLASYYGADLSNFRKLAGDKWKIEQALVSDLAGLWSKYTNRTLESLEKQLHYLEYESYSPDINQIRELQAVVELRKALSGQWGDLVDFTPAPGSTKSGKTAAQLAYEKNKSLFEEEYAAWKHKLDMEQISLEQFYNWLDGQDGYKKYFQAQGLSLDDFRKYEKEVFDGSRDIHEQYLNALDHEIRSLEHQEGNENAIISKYREKQAVLRELIEDLHTYLKAAGMSDAAIAMNEQMLAYQSELASAGDAVEDVYQAAIDRIKASINSLIDLTRDMVKQEAEDMIDALEAQKDAYSELVSKRKELLQLAQREKQYQDEVADKSKEISRLQARINALSLDDSREAAIERGTLEEELAQLQKDLADKQNEHYVEVTEDALDKEADDFSKLQDEKIGEIRAFLNDNEALNRAALNRLDTMNQNLFDDLTAYALKYTSTTRAELEDMWATATKAAEKYGSVTNASKVYEDGDVENKVQTIISQMRANGNAYAETTDKKKQQEYSDSSLRLGAQLQQLLGIKVYRDNNGVWWIGNQKLFEVYHSGTPSVGMSPTPKQNEMMAMLQKGEMVLNEKQQSSLWSFLKSFSPATLFDKLASAQTVGQTYEAAGAGGPNIAVTLPMTVYGDLTEENKRFIKEHGRYVAKVVSGEIRGK